MRRRDWAETWLNVRLFSACGTALAIAAFTRRQAVRSLMPGPISGVGSPAFFLLRTGTNHGAHRGRVRVGVEKRVDATGAPAIAPARAHRTAGVRCSSSAAVRCSSIGFTSRWVYRLISLRIHKRLTHPQAWLALAAFTLLMFVCTVLKDRYHAASPLVRRAPPPAIARLPAR